MYLFISKNLIILLSVTYLHGAVYTKSLLFPCSAYADIITTLCRHVIIHLKNYTFLSDLTYVTYTVFSNKKYFIVS